MTLDFPSAQQIIDVLVEEKRQAEAAEQAKIENFVKEIAKCLRNILTNPYANSGSKGFTVDASHLSESQADRFLILAEECFSPKGYTCKLNKPNRKFTINWE